MDSNTVPILLVTANVGSIFENPDESLEIWCEEFLSIVKRLDCKFIALHCQEVGGKNYEKSMKHVENFVNILMSSNELRIFDRVQVFLDEDYSSAEHFTALGNLYFIHDSIEDILIWDFKNDVFLPVCGKEIHAGNIEAVVTKEKAKFPQEFFPECKWSRKGFLRTRWSLNGTVFDLVNIHLFHDASNFVAMETSPSVYSKNRRRALEHTLGRFHHGKIPYFLFGDFNFRTDTNTVVKKITEGLNTNRVQNNKNNDYTKIHYTNDEDKLVLCIGKKEFCHPDLSSCIPSVDLNPIWLKSYDKELEPFEDFVTEYPVNFPPSYPFEEDVDKPSTYMPTRCPSWCDRVLLSHSAKELISEDYPVEYNLMGVEACMGDHKPVYLNANFKAKAGTVQFCGHVPATCPYKIASVKINITDMSDMSTPYKTYQYVREVDSTLLHEPITREMLMHEPYTPESAESHSPLPDKVVNSKVEPVSPKLLKSKLEHILEHETNAEAKVIERSRSEIDERDIDTRGYMDVRSNSIPVPILEETNTSLKRYQPDERLNSSSQESVNVEKVAINDRDKVDRKKSKLRFSGLHKRNKCCSIS